MLRYTNDEAVGTELLYNQSWQVTVFIFLLDITRMLSVLLYERRFSGVGSLLSLGSHTVGLVVPYRLYLSGQGLTITGKEHIKRYDEYLPFIKKTVGLYQF